MADIAFGAANLAIALQQIHQLVGVQTAFIAFDSARWRQVWHHAWQYCIDCAARPRYCRPCSLGNPAPAHVLFEPGGAERSIGPASISSQPMRTASGGQAGGYQAGGMDVIPDKRTGAVQFL